MKTIFLFIYLLTLAALLYETEQQSHQAGPQDFYSDQCHTLPAVFSFFKAWKCSESGYQRIMEHCAKFLAITNHQKPNQIPDISQKVTVSKIIMLHEKKSFDEKSACCLMEFSSYKSILLQAFSNRKPAISLQALSDNKPAIVLGCDIVIVVWNRVDDLGNSRRNKKRSVLPKKESVNKHQLNVTAGAIFENSSVRVTRGATNSSVWNISSKLNETELKKIRERLAIRFSHDPQWAMVSMTFLILLILFAVKCCKLTDSAESDMEYVDYIDDFHTTTVNEVIGRKFAFIELIKRFKNRRKRKKKKKNSEEKQGLLSKKRSHSDGEENIQDESDDFIAL